MWRGAKTALEEKIENVAFLRTRIEFITSCFGVDEIDEIWITFPDPRPKDKQEKKRLTSPNFIKCYQEFLKPQGIIHLKTDNQFFYEYTLSEIENKGYTILESTDDLYNEKIKSMDVDTRDILNIETHYEAIFKEKGHSIHYLKFKL